MNITFTATNAKELKLKMQDFWAEFNVPGVETDRQLSLVPVGEMAADSQPEKTQKTEPKKRAPKAKAATQFEADTEAADVGLEKEVVETKKAAPTKESVISILKEINDKRGLEAARELLSKFKCSRVSELAPDQYQAFISDCQATLLV